jgi:alpha-tubulin suppressor-like RCC1 family protein
MLVRVLVGICAVLVGCDSSSTETYSVGGTVTGLASTGLVLGASTGESLMVASDGDFELSTKLAPGSPYAVEITTQPVNGTCAIANSTGVIGDRDVHDVVITCTSTDALVRGTVTGLVGSGLVLRNGSEMLPINEDGPFTFTAAIAPHATYAVTIETQPSSPLQGCVVAHGSGTAGPGGVTDIAVTCASPAASLVTAGGVTCSLHADGSLWCWGGNNSMGELGVATSVQDGVAVNVEPESQWIAIAPGDGASCAIRSDRTLWCWGMNVGGELGDGTTIAHSTPGQVGTTADWVAASVGMYYACGIQGDGSMWCWGENSEGQLGDGTTTGRTSPVRIGTTNDWVQVASGRSHTCAIRADATLWCWGDNSFYALGDGTTQNEPRPHQVGTDEDWLAVTVAQHTCALKLDGTLWCWGFNAFGQVGATTDFFVPLPTQVDGTGWTQIAADLYNSCGLKADGEVWCWGNNDGGEIGDGTFVRRVTPARTLLGAAAREVSVGNQHACARTTDGTVWCWGENGFGQLGLGRSCHKAAPVQIASTATWTDVAAASQTCAIQTDGTLWCWGARTYSNTAQFQSQVPVPFAPGTDWKHVVAADSHACALKTDDTLWCWGSNASGQLGDDTTIDRAAPTEVGGAWRDVSVGSAHTCGIKADGTLWCWGANDYGQSAGSSIVPHPVGTETWIAVGAGFEHSCAIRSDSTMWCWGNGASGQLGNGSSSPTAVLVQAGTDATWTSVSVGIYHSCGIQAGDAMCWGAIAGATSRPTRMLSSVTVVQAGGYLAAALQTDGTIWEWGTQPPGATQTTAVADWLTFAHGHDHKCGIRADHTIWCWGRDERGQLGDNDTWFVTPMRTEN